MSLRWLSILSVFLVASSVYAQQPSSPAPTSDPQAVAILAQVLANAGGAARLASIQDFTGTGNITYSQPSTMSGTVIVRGTTQEQFRIDATLPAGVRSQAIALHDVLSLSWIAQRCWWV